MHGTTSAFTSTRGLLFGMLLCLALPLAAGQGDTTMQINEMVQRIDWLGQAAVRISAGSGTVYLDPYKLQAAEPAALVLVTHSHADHCSPDDLAKVVGQETVLVAPQDCLDKVAELPAEQILTLRPGEQATIADIRIDAVPAYNVVKTRFHPEDNAWVGYILTIDGVRIYHFGDTERVPEMKDLTCDIALLPLGQTYTMESVEQAVEAVRDVKAAVAIPIHYGMYEGTKEDATTFQKLLAGTCQVVIKEQQ